VASGIGDGAAAGDLAVAADEVAGGLPGRSARFGSASVRGGDDGRGSNSGAGVRSGSGSADIPDFGAAGCRSDGRDRIVERPSVEPDESGVGAERSKRTSTSPPSAHRGTYNTRLIKF